ncbi:MAG: hypothetical protein CMN85_10670 [Spongiibacteraceae bacterium]|nr:hypothetical protein [Spongiibacteraceae bacterium]
MARKRAENTTFALGSIPALNRRLKMLSAMSGNGFGCFAVVAGTLNQGRYLLPTPKLIPGHLACVSKFGQKKLKC